MSTSAYDYASSYQKQAKLTGDELQQVKDTVENLIVNNKDFLIENPIVKGIYEKNPNDLTLNDLETLKYQMRYTEESDYYEMGKNPDSMNIYLIKYVFKWLRVNKERINDTLKKNPNSFPEKFYGSLMEQMYRFPVQQGTGGNYEKWKDISKRQRQFALQQITRFHTPSEKTAYNNMYEKAAEKYGHLDNDEEENVREDAKKRSEKRKEDRKEYSAKRSRTDNNDSSDIVVEKKTFVSIDKWYIPEETIQDFFHKHPSHFQAFKDYMLNPN